MYTMQTYYPCKFALIAHAGKYKYEYDTHLKGRHVISLLALACLVLVHLHE